MDLLRSPVAQLPVSELLLENGWKSETSWEAESNGAAYNEISPT